MIFNAFIHADANEVFRSNVTQFVNDSSTHPVLKYQAFIVVFILVVSGLFILLLFNGERIFGHSYWSHWFSPLVISGDNDDGDDDNGDVFRPSELSESAIFRQAVEGMTTTDTGKTTTKDGKFVSADTDAPEKQKKTPCGTDCGQYLELQGKIKELSKYVNAVKDQTAQINETTRQLQTLGKQVEDLNKSLSPGGKVNITI